MSNKFQGSWFHDTVEWRNTCANISLDLTSFKRNPNYISIIANDLRDESVARSFFAYVQQNYSYLLNYITKFQQSDTIGSPNIFNIEGIDISPGTLRFIKVLGDINQFNPKSIIEIGSGYGGQCKIIKDYLDVDYTLVDIPESLNVAKAYLTHFNTPATFISTENVITKDNYDLVISDYCLSELDTKGIDFYFEEIISKCNYGYFTVNSNNDLRTYLLDKLKNCFESVNVKDEEPRTTTHNNIIVTCKR